MMSRALLTVLARSAASAPIGADGGSREPFETLRDGSVNGEAHSRARQWLRDHVHFDLLAYDDWLARRADRAQSAAAWLWLSHRRPHGDARDPRRSAERLDVAPTSRRCVWSSKKSARARQPGARRARRMGWAAIARRRAPRSPWCAKSCSAPCAASWTASRRPTSSAACPSPQPWSTTAAPATSIRRCARRTAARARSTSGRSAAQPAEPPATPLRALERLQHARAERQGAHRPAEAPQSPTGARLLEHNRDETVDWILRPHRRRALPRPVRGSLSGR